MSAPARAPQHCRPRTGEDACPGVLRIHRALDGGLARVRLPGGRANPTALTALADAARLGSGIAEITSRGNVQLRGLPDDAGAALGELLSAAGLVPSFDHERARNVIASPLAGRTTGAVDIDEIVTALDRGICADPALAKLSGRFCFGVEDGSGAILGREYDVLLTPEGDQFTLFVGGTDTGRRAPAPEAATLALEAARAFLAESGGDPKVWRVKDLQRGSDPTASATSVPSPTRGLTPPGGEPIRLSLGTTPQSDGKQAVTALPPLGRLSPFALDRLAAITESEATEVRFAPARTLSVIDLHPDSAEAVERALEDLGLVLDPESGWHGLSACAGLRACERARADVRAAAARRARVRPAGAPAEHWTACERRCGERAEIPVAVSVTANGAEVRDRGRELTVAGVDAACEALEAR